MSSNHTTTMTMIPFLFRLSPCVVRDEERKRRQQAASRLSLTVRPAASQQTDGRPGEERGESPPHTTASMSHRRQFTSFSFPLSSPCMLCFTGEIATTCGNTFLHFRHNFFLSKSLFATMNESVTW